MALITHTPVWTALAGSAAFLPGDCIKAVIASLIAVQLKAISPIQEKARI
jgi:biotin transport system substrate-specific component